MTADNFVLMSPGDLAKAWPDYAETHDISDTELARIASMSRDAVRAGEIWENEDWWRDESEVAVKPLENEIEWWIARGVESFGG